MPTTLNLFAASLLLAAAPAGAQSPFNGAWKGSLASASVQGKPDRFKIVDGVYSCASCIPAWSAPADGAYHHVAGKDYWDEASITVVDDHTVKYSYRKAGKVIGENLVVASADGMTLTNTSHNTNNAAGTPVDAVATETRVGTPIAGAHIVSGDWKFAPATSISDAALTMTISVENGALHMKSGTGETIDAKIGGGYAPNVGDPGGTVTKVAQLGPRTLQLTDLRGGKVVQVSTYTVGADGVLKGSWKDPRNGDTGTFTAIKQ